MRCILLIGTLITAGACEDRVADQTEHAAGRVTKASDHLRHQRGELSASVADRADDRIADDMRDVSREAGKLATAQDDFTHAKALRVASLKAAHSVAASQPLLIQAISAETQLTPAIRLRFEDNMRLFREQLAATRHAIDELGFATAADWERRDDLVKRQMAGLYLARDASWQVLDTTHRDTPFPGT